MPRNTDTFIVRDNRGPKYLKVYNDFYDRFGSVLGPYGIAVYVALCRYIDVDSSECNPSYATIARGTGMSRRKVIYEIQELERLGVLAIEHIPYKPNVFTLLETSACHAPLTSAHHAPPSAPHAPKQESNNNYTQMNSNKKKRAARTKAEPERRIYCPDEYKDIIIH
jgi:hypothetical protein